MPRKPSNAPASRQPIGRIRYLLLIRGSIQPIVDLGRLNRKIAAVAPFIDFQWVESETGVSNHFATASLLDPTYIQQATKIGLCDQASLRGASALLLKCLDQGSVGSVTD